MAKFALAGLLVVAIFTTSTVWAQHTASTAGRTVVKPIATPPAAAAPAAASPLADNNLGTLVRVANRARVLGNSADATGNRYYAVKGHELVGKTPTEVAKRLSPPVVTAEERVKRMDILIDVRHPIVILATGNTPVMIGTTVFEGNVKDIKVIANIILNEVKIVKK